MKIDYSKSLSNKAHRFLNSLNRDELILLAKSWTGHDGVNWETTRIDALIALCYDAMMSDVDKQKSK